MFSSNILNFCFQQGDKLSYIESELEALEREQEAIDQKASSLEKKLRAVMGGNPSNNRFNRKLKQNSFIRLIRRSIGGGETIRIKLLDMEKGEFSLSPSGSEEDSLESETSQSSNDDEDANVIQYQSVLRPQRPPRKNQNVKRQRSKSCFVEMLEIPSSPSPPPTYFAHEHDACENSKSFVTSSKESGNLSTNKTAAAAATTQPYNILSSNSSNQSSCDNFLNSGDDDRSTTANSHYNTQVVLRKQQSRRASGSQEQNRLRRRSTSARSYGQTRRKCTCGAGKR